jgi:hypothetical protein
MESIIYNIKKFFYPLNVIKLNLPNEWFDVDDKMFAVMKTLFIDFVELEKPLIPYTDKNKFTKTRFTDLNEMSRQLNLLLAEVSYSGEKLYEINSQILSLYKWFKLEHPAMLTELESLYAQPNYDGLKCFNLEQSIAEQENIKLKHLIDLRKYFWT